MGHGHSHGDKSSGADGWTKAGAVGELVASLISDSYWVGATIDMVIQLAKLEAEDVGVGLSWYGIGFGLGVAMLSAAGSAYSHSVLNINNQQDRTEKPEQQDDHDDESPLLVDIPKDEIMTSKKPVDVSLTWLQRLALVGDFISHTGDIAGPITFVGSLTTEKLALPFYAKPLTQCAATLFGAATSVANVRTCRNSMHELNKNYAKCIDETDEADKQAPRNHAVV